ncbi:MAG TPA: hypothetical protein VGQ31_09265 [Candidatus Limnocylindrales bacterium]|nr:hypothetical protein [Candidatus Limnocylindrales bacterium]
MSRRIAGLLLAVVAAAGLLAGPVGVAEVRAAAPDLTIVSDARYDVQPADHRVHVTLDMVLTNHLHDTSTKRFYFDRAFISVLPDTSGFKLTWSGSGTPKATVSKKTATYTVVQLDLATKLFSGKSASYRLAFDLVDPGGDASRDVRIGTSLASFPVWAFATDATPGSTVTVTFPAGYQVEVESGDIPAPTTGTDGVVTLRTGKLAEPLKFFAYLVADRTGSYADRTVSAAVGSQPVALTIRSWADDPAWSKRVGDLMARGLPAIATEVGLDWPRSGGLTVRESVSRTTGGYAGLFDPSQGTIDVAYYADDFVVLHESAHAWFNGSLLADRWADEGFASYYGLQAAKALGIKAAADPLTDELKAARIPLNAWGAIGREDDTTEDYAYAATVVLAQAIAERAGPQALKAVWADAAAKVGAYQPPASGDGATTTAPAASAAPETVSAPPDWRGLLDLLEEHSTSSFDDLWRTWVARDTDLPLLDDRTAARADYDAVVAQAGDWQLPRSVRDAMRAWQFDQATGLLAEAKTVLDQRTAIANQAAAAGLTAPSTLETAFAADDGFTSATAEASAELDAIGHYRDAVAARPVGLDAIQEIGVWGTAPDSDLARARSLFASGDLAGSATAAAAAASTWSGAEALGQTRLIGAAGVAIALLVALGALGYWLVRRRHRRASPAVTPDAYATLAATPDPIGPADAAVPFAAPGVPDAVDEWSGSGGEGPD